MNKAKRRSQKEIASDLADYFERQMSPEAKGLLDGKAREMMYNAAMLVLAGGGPLSHAKYIFWCYLTPQYAKQKLPLVMDREVYDYWTKDVPALMKDPRAKDIVEVFNGEFKRITNKVMISADASLTTFVRVRVYREMEPLQFVARVREYTPSSDEKAKKIEDFGCVGEVLVAPNGKKIGENRERTRGALKDYVYKNYDKLLEISQRQAPVFKSGRQKLITIKIDGADFEIIGNTDDEETTKYYDELKSDLKKILESAKN